MLLAESIAQVTFDPTGVVGIYETHDRNSYAEQSYPFAILSHACQNAFISSGLPSEMRT